MAPQKIITANYTTAAALNALVKKFMVQTNLKDISISQNALINIYAGPATNATQLKAIHTVIENAFKKNGIYTYQYKIIDSGLKKVATVEMFIQKKQY